jgi:DNA-binding transcriptional LysR family regulator
MDRFSALQTLVSVVDRGGFSAAADALGLSPPVVTRQIAALEAELGTRLLARSTRTVALTEAGGRYLAKVRGILAALAAADHALQGKQAESFQRLRLAAPSAVGVSLVAPALAAFMEGQRGLCPQLDVLDRPVNAADEGYDMVFSLGPANDDREPLAQIPVGLIAAPAYCALHGRPRSPEDLGAHQGLLLAGKTGWHLRGGVNIVPLHRFTSNRWEVLKELCIAAKGIALLPLHLVQRETAVQELTQILDGFEPKPYGLYADCPQGRDASPAGEAFVKLLSQRLRRM